MKMILSGKKKNDHVNVKKNRILIVVNVVGSSGPLRFVVNEDDKVSSVVGLSLKFYARGGRLPVLGLNSNEFVLYASKDGSALNSSEEIGSCGGRYFVLCKKKRINNQAAEKRTQMITRQHSGRWKSCILCIAQ